METTEENDQEGKSNCLLSLVTWDIKELQAKWVKVLDYCDLIFKWSKSRELDPYLVATLILWESGGDKLAYSSSGAVGLMQVMPKDGIAATFQCVSGPCFVSRPTIAELQKAGFNIEYGTGMLAGLLGREGNIRDALKAYGPANVGYYYADKILSLYEKIKQ